MNKLQQTLLSNLKNHLIFAAVLVLSILFFFYKGISYLVLGSSVPLILISAITILFFLSSRKSEKSFRRITGLWAIVIISWSLVRLLLSLTNQFIKPVPESHVAEQLGVLGSMQSLLFLIGGIYLWRHKNRIVKK